MQPLDVSFFKPLNQYYFQEVDKWMRANHGCRVSLYSMASLFGKAYSRAATVANATSGFRRSGIWPQDGNIFTPDDYRPSNVTSRQSRVEEQQSHISILASSSSNGSPHYKDVHNPTTTLSNSEETEDEALNSISIGKGCSRGKGAHKGKTIKRKVKTAIAQDMPSTSLIHRQSKEVVSISSTDTILTKSEKETQQILSRNNHCTIFF